MWGPCKKNNYVKTSMYRIKYIQTERLTCTEWNRRHICTDMYRVKEMTYMHWVKESPTGSERENLYTSKKWKWKINIQTVDETEDWYI